MTITLQDALGLKPKQTETPKRRSMREKTDHLIQLIFKGRCSFTEAAKQVGISRTTAWRYWQKWKETEEASHIDWEWWSLYQHLRDENPERAFDGLTRLKYRMTPNLMDIQKTVDITNRTIKVELSSKLLSSEVCFNPKQSQSNTNPTEEQKEPDSTETVTATGTEQSSQA